MRKNDDAITYMKKSEQIVGYGPRVQRVYKLCGICHGVPS